jgi:hypothetical protein
VMTRDKISCSRSIINFSVGAVVLAGLRIPVLPLVLEDYSPHPQPSFSFPFLSKCRFAFQSRES